MTNSPVGTERREAILKAMLAEAGRLRRRRRLVRGGGVLLATAAVALTLIPRDRDGDVDVERPAAAPNVDVANSGKAPNDAAFEPRAAPVQIEIVHTRPGIAAEHAMEPTASGGVVELISDEELLQELGRLGRPAAIVRTVDQVLLTDPDGNRLVF